MLCGAALAVLVAAANQQPPPPVVAAKLKLVDVAWRYDTGG
jgi:hypothetical protein